MFRNLCKIGLSIAGRQNEMIELALTNGYRSIEIDMEDMLGRADSFGNDFACQFINSCNVSVGVFQLPVDFGASDEQFGKFKARLDHMLEICESIDARRCYAVIAPGSDDMPYHENFERQRGRVAEIAQKLAEKNIQLGLALDAFAKSRENKSHQFICTAEDLGTFIKAIGQPNVGLALDTFQWSLGGGSMDQLDQLGIGSIVDVCFSDCPSDVDAGQVTNADRLLPSKDPVSICKNVFTWLETNQYEGPITVGASAVKLQLEDASRIVKLYKRSLDLLDGTLVEEPPAEEADAEATNGEAVEATNKKPEPVGTES